MNTCLAEGDVHQETVRLRGELDVATLEELRRTLRRAVASSTAEVVVVDLEAVTFLDAGTVGALLKARVEARAAGRQFALSGVSPRIHRVLRLFGAETEFDIVP